jgi:hypothetical protein
MQTQEGNIHNLPNINLFFLRYWYFLSLQKYWFCNVWLNSYKSYDIYVILITFCFETIQVWKHHSRKQTARVDIAKQNIQNAAYGDVIKWCMIKILYCHPVPNGNTSLQSFTYKHEKDLRSPMLKVG